MADQPATVLQEYVAQLEEENARLREEKAEAWNAAIEAAAQRAMHGGLVPPDGGAPTEEERMMCDMIADDIMRLKKETPDADR